MFGKTKFERKELEEATEVTGLCRRFVYLMVPYI
jgi:hypothetical protein